MSGCCFNQVESQSGTDLQFVERPLIHMGFITGFGENQFQEQLFSHSLVAKLEYFYFLQLSHTDTKHNQ